MGIEPRSEIKKMKAYVPPLDGRRSGGKLLLDFNERTLAPSDAVIKALENFAWNGKLQVYPEYSDIANQLSRYLGVANEQLMLSNGSDNAIDTFVRCYLDKGEKIVIPQPSFSMFAHSAHLQGGVILQASYDLISGYPFEQVVSLIEKEKPRIVIVCNPNNPTGTVLSQAKIEKLVSTYPNIAFLIDEAYYEFLEETSIALIQKYQNVGVTRTFSKAMGIPALRFGYLVADASMISELIKVRGPYAVNMMSVAAAQAALANDSYVIEYVKEVMTISKPMIESYYTSRGIKFWPSGCNFHLIDLPKPTFEKDLEQEGIRVRQMTYPGFENSVRLSIGTKSDTEKLIMALDKIL